MEDNSILFRFVEYDYKTYYTCKFSGHEYIAGIRIKESYDRFFKMLESMKGHVIMLRNKPYIIDEIVMSYNDEEGSLFCVNVFLLRESIGAKI